MAAAGKVLRLLHSNRQKVAQHSAANVSAIRLCDLLREHPIVTLATVLNLLKTTEPTAANDF